MILTYVRVLIKKKKNNEKETEVCDDGERGGRKEERRRRRRHFLRSSTSWLVHSHFKSSGNTLIEMMQSFIGSTVGIGSNIDTEVTDTRHRRLSEAMSLFTMEDLIKEAADTVKDRLPEHLRRYYCSTICCCVSFGWKALLMPLLRQTAGGDHLRQRAEESGREARGGGRDPVHRYPLHPFGNSR